MFFTLASTAAPAEVRVGVYDNAPKIYTDEDGRPSGFWPELLRVMAARSDLEIEWVPGSWDEGLARLEAGRIDIMPDVAHTPERATRFAFNTIPVHVSWSRIYVPGGVNIDALHELDGMRIAGLAGSSNIDAAEGIGDLLQRLGIEATLLPMDSYAATFRALEEGHADAAITNRDFGNRMEDRFAVARTPITFQPVELHFALSRDAAGTAGLIDTLDSELQALKADHGSPYYTLMDRWLGVGQTDHTHAIPAWAIWGLLTLLGGALLAVVSLLYVASRLRQRTAELSRQHERLRHREDMLNASQRIASVGSWREDLQSREVEWSAEKYRLLGLEPGALTPTPDTFLDYVLPEDRERVRIQRERAREGLGPYDLEYRVQRADGEVRFVHERGERRTEGDRATATFAGTVQDVTQSRLADERLGQYRRLIESATDLFFVVDANYRYVIANDGYAALFGHDHRSIQGRAMDEIMDADLLEHEVRPHITACLEGEPQTLEVTRHFDRVGLRRFLVRYFPLESGDGNSRQAGGIITDITTLRATEEELEQHRRLVDLAGRVARVGGWSLDLDQKEVTWTDITAEIHGMPPGYSPDLDTAIEFYAPEHRQRITELVRACTEDGIAYKEELEIVHTSGRRIWTRALGEPTYDEEGRIVGAQGAFQDISGEKKARLDLERVNQRLASILESITDGFLTIDRSWTFRYVNPEAGRILQRAPEELSGRNTWEAFPEGAGTAFEQALLRTMEEREPVAYEAFFAPLGAWLEMRAYPSDDGLALYFRDVSDRHRMFEQLQEQERQLRDSRDHATAALEMRQALINALPAHIALVDGDGMIMDVNTQWRDYGQTHHNPDPEYGIGQNYLDICEATVGEFADDAEKMRAGMVGVLRGEQPFFSLEYPCHGPSEKAWFRVSVNPLSENLDGPGARGAVVMHIDITERKLAEQELNRLAYEDALTGLPSRNGFVRDLAQAIKDNGWDLGGNVVLLDLAQQRDINDVHGYEVGDQLLIEVGERLARQAGAGGVVGRIGGDEFAVFLPPRSDRSASQQRGDIAEVFHTHFQIGGQLVETHARFGYTTLAGTRRPPEELVREAELALFSNDRNAPQDPWKAYSDELDEQSRRRVEVTRELRHALTHDEFELHFHPKVMLESGQLVACEALIRWNHPERGLLSPGLFIPIAEQSQLIAPIGDWAIREACHHLRAWKEEGLEIVRVAVNVSPVQLTSGNFAATVRDALDAEGVSPASLTLEITESVFELESEALHAQVRALHELGVRLSLDDFGTGYSSLLYLQKYPFDEIKIDQGFVRRMLEDDYSHNIVDTVLSLADALGAEIVAEGIENEATRDALLAMGCRVGQGFHYSLPLAAEDFRWLLEKHSTLPLSTAQRKTASAGKSGRT